MKISRSRLLFAISIFVIIIFSLSMPVYARTLVVSKDKSEFSSIQSAIKAASTGDKVLIEPGKYEETLKIDSSLTLKGKSGGNILISGVRESRPVIAVGPSRVDVALNNLTLSGAKGDLCADISKAVCPSGISVTGKSTVTIQGSKIIDNDRGGIIAVDSAQVLVEGSKIVDNGRFGVWLSASAHISMENTFIAENKTGITASKGAQVDVENSKIVRNKGFGLTSFGMSKLRLTSINISNNGKGGLRAENSSAAILEGNTFTGNRGAAILLNSSASATLNENTITSNHVGISNLSDGNLGLKLNEISNNSIDLVGNLKGKARTPSRKQTRGRIVLPNEKYPNFQSAVDSLLPGGTIFLEDDAEGGAVIDKKIIITSKGEKVTVKNPDTYKSPVFSLVRDADLKIEGVSVNGSADSGIVMGANSRLSLENSVIRDHREDGVELWNSSRLGLRNAAIVNNGGNGVRLVDSSIITLSEGAIKGNNGNGLIMADSARGTMKSSEVSNNKGQGVIMAGDSRFFAASSEIKENRRNGVKVTEKAECRFRKSVTARNKNSGFTLLSSAELKISSNTISYNSTGISIRDKSKVDINNSLLLGNDTGIEVNKPNNFIGEINGGKNEFLLNGSEFTGVSQAKKEELIE